MSTSRKDAVGPLHGIKVVDFSGFIAGCYAAQLFGDLGAEVVKVEPLTGDGARYWGPFIRGESRFFQGWNRNKQSIALDLRSEEGLEIVRSLVGKADIVVENFRPGITKKLGIDYDSLRTCNEQLIYLSITAFGGVGPHGSRPGYDPILQSMTGTVRANERYTGGVGICSVAVSDYGAGMLGSGAVLAALYHREKTGEGQLIRTTLLQAAMAIQNHSFVKPLEAEEEPPFGIYPYRLFDTKDDLIFIAGPTDKFWQALCNAIGAPELGTDPSYLTNALRVDHADELNELLSPILKTKTTAEWEVILVAAGVPCAPVGTYEEFFETEQVAAMGMNPIVEHSKIGPMHLAGVPVDLERTPGSIRRPPPTLGEHTDEILAGIGYDKERVDALRKDGIVR
ncbi:MAG: CoA transferase [Candidatus Hydrogenedentes bacterium]|nr:CoA transferase [Candidatus Hydrogenedentota bacterium]